MATTIVVECEYIRDDRIMGSFGIVFLCYLEFLPIII